MRRVLCVLAVLLTLGLAAVASAEHHENALKQEVAAIGEAFAKAIVADDFEAMLSMYTEDAISLPNFSPRLDGIAAFRENHDQMAAAGMKVHAFSTTPIDVWQAGDQVIEIGSYEITLSMPGAPGQIEDKGKYVTIYVRGEDGKLKVKVETWNTDANPMEMGMPGGEPEHEHGHEHDHGHDHGA